MFRVAIDGVDGAGKTCFAASLIINNGDLDSPYIAEPAREVTP